MPSLILFLCAGLTGAQTSSANAVLVVASGFLCDAGDSGSCPAIAKSANGDTYEISGAGTFDPHNKSVNAAGTFSHKSTNGDVLETGVWVGSDLISFDSYGIAPAALMQKGAAPGRPQVGPKRLPIGSGLLPTGGLAKFHILLMPILGPTRKASLEVNCALGDVPRDRSVEGIRLQIDRNSTDYSEEAGGRVMFLATRSPVSATAKAPEQDAPEAVGPPQNQR